MPDEQFIKLPEFLVRDDGERLKLNGDGTYSFVNSLMSPAYKYSFTSLMNMGGFKIETEDLILADGLPNKTIGDLRIIRSKEDWEDFYYYKKSKLKKYPTEYPCVAKMESENGGIGGGYMQHYVTYFPKGAQSNFAYCLGLNAAWRPL